MNKYELKEIVWGYLEFCRTKDERFQDCSQAITAMTFLSPPELQWEMILEAVHQARDQHGEAFVNRVRTKPKLTQNMHAL